MEIGKIVSVEVDAPQVVLISGSMFSGKSKRLIEVIDSFKENNKEVLIFKPKLDKRDLGVVKSRDFDKTYDAHLIGDGKHPNFKQGYLDTVDAIIVDEAQFLDKRALYYILGLQKGYKMPVIFAGLDKDFKGEEFSIITEIKKEKPLELNLRAKCFICGELSARQSRRVIDNKIVLEGDQVLCGDKESYIAVCDTCDKKLMEGRGR